MEYYKIILGIHIVSGFGALFGGLFPMFAKKGSRLHVLTGWIYFWAMFGGFITTTAMFCLKQSPGMLFLMLIGILSFHLTLSGVRAVALKKKGTKATLFDWLSSGFVLLCGVTMVGLSIYHWINESSAFFYILFAVFGVVTFESARENLVEHNKRRKGIENSKHWMYLHVTKMGGAYIATTTAFVVTNFRFMPELFNWLAPAVVGTIVLHRVSNKYFTKDRRSLRKKKPALSKSSITNTGIGSE